MLVIHRSSVLTIRMEHLDEHTDALIARHLAGEATPEEEAALQTWAEQSPENTRYLADLHALWGKSPALRPAQAVDTEAALRRVKSRLQQVRQPRMVRLAVVWRAAAAVLLAVVAGYFLWVRSPQTPQVVIAATDTARTDTLSDGSVVTLGTQSGLTLAAGFNARERRMRLHGQATFTVQPDPERPFVVEVDDLEVQVVGTVFRVDNAAEPAQVRVDVTEGRVRVRARGQELYLSAGDAAVYDRESGALVAGQSQNRVLRFDATPLREVIRRIEGAYNTQIDLKNSNLENCLLTARYNSLPLERVLELIAESFGIRVEKTDEGYALDGEGCE